MYAHGIQTHFSISLGKPNKKKPTKKNICSLASFADIFYSSDSCIVLFDLHMPWELATTKF